jgi:hypothetical protein
MRNLSKSKLIAYQQCERRLWLEVHRPELRKDSEGAEARMAAGNELGALARSIYDPDGKGALVDPQKEGFGPALQRSKALLESSAPIFEAGFAAGGGLALADVMLPTRRNGRQYWRMVEVKSSTSVKDYHREDAAIQAYVAREAGVALDAIAVAHIDSDWVYPGTEDYHGLLVEEDLTEEATAKAGEVKEWIAAAQGIVAKNAEPEIATGRHCKDPFECGFLAHCRAGEPQAEYPVEWLPRLQKKSVQDFIETKAIRDIRDVPDEYLTDIQRRVKEQTLAGKPYFDRASAAAELSAHKLPAYFLDFETVQFTIPIWKGTRAYQQIPFQFSLHRLSRSGALEHRQFQEMSGEDPSEPFAQALIRECRGTGPIFVYNAGFESARIKELAERFRRLAPELEAIADRIVDLLPIARRHYYHPDQQGSWSIKSVLPVIAPDLRYDALEGVNNGALASAAYLEAIRPHTTLERREEVHRQLTDYCHLDTYALVRLWQSFSGRGDLRL